MTRIVPLSPLPLAALCSLASAAPAKACAMALALGLDVSASVSATEYHQQQLGLAAALTDTQVVDAVRDIGGLWIAAFEWSGEKHQYSQLKWSFVDDVFGLEAVAGTLRDTPRLAKDFPTSVGHALDYAMRLFEELPEPCARAVIDISSDGEINEGIAPAQIYDAHDMGHVTVNALVITKDKPEVAAYYTQEVIYGAGAFVEIALTYQEYADAMSRKLLREIGARSYAMIMP
ncbi:MAG: DUF1194 domain-containing protein [Maritimibacter sp.]